MTNNIFDMLQVMCDAAILIADDNWGDANVAEYVRSRVPDCQHVEAFRDILHPVIARRKKTTATNEESTDRIDIIYKLFRERDKKGLCGLRSDIHTELQELNTSIYEFSLDAKAAEILEKADEYNKLQSEIGDRHARKQNLEKLDGLIVKLINLLK